MKYQISNTASTPRWVDNYVLNHHMTLVHNQLKAAGELDSFYNKSPAERNKMWVQMAESAGIRDISLEDDQVWIDIPDNGDTLIWMLKA
jgi:hypothetical protein